MTCSDCDNTGCPECGGAEECDDNACTGCPWCDAHGITRERDDTPECNCGTCTPPDFTCIRED